MSVSLALPVIFHAGVRRDSLALWQSLPLLHEKLACKRVIVLPEATPVMSESVQKYASAEQAFLTSTKNCLASVPFVPEVVVAIGTSAQPRPEYFATVQRLLCDLALASTVRFFVSVLRQDIRWEQSLARRTMFKGLPAFPRTRPNNLKPGLLGPDHYTMYRSAVQVFGLDNVYLHIDAFGGEEQGRLSDAWHAFWAVAGCMGMPVPDEGLLELPQLLPQAFWAFCRHCPIDGTFLQENAWERQARHFVGWPGKHILPYTLRKEVCERFAVSDRLLARQLNKKILFEPPLFDEATEPDPDFSLDQESALAVATRLDHNFACARLADMEATPIHYLTREQRIVREALHEVCTPTSATPLLRHREEELKLSVLTLTYNHKEFIGQCIESVIEQQVNFSFQHIIADDGSDDGTQDIILEYAAKYPHIVPIMRKDRVHTRWQNVFALFDMARTEYAALCDGDDYFTDPAKLQMQVDFLEQHKSCALCFHVVHVLYEDDPDRERFYPPVELLPRGIRTFYYLSDLLKFNMIQTNSVMYRWRFTNGLPHWFRSDLVPGDWYWHLLHAESGKIGFINKVMSVYRRHKKGLYYLSEIDRLKHRATMGLQELTTYDVVNKHFNGKYQSILMDLANGVFADCLLYDSQQQDEHEERVLDKLCDRYPEFAKYFLVSLKDTSKIDTKIVDTR